MKLCHACKLQARANHSSYCKPCKNEKARTYSKKHQPVINERSAERRRKIAAKVYALKESGSCVDCGRSDHHYLMDYDHLGDKVMGIAQMISANKSFETILLEIKKCELVCVRCHRIRTYDRSTSQTLPV